MTWCRGNVCKTVFADHDDEGVLGEPRSDDTENGRRCLRTTQTPVFM